MRTLDDRYVETSGRHFLSGLQALVKLPLLQRELDRRNGLDTAGLITGYRGSPLGNYDGALWAAQRHLDASRIHFQPGVNEDLAATACWGSQQANVLSLEPRYDGVFAIWYGKGPGVDRSSDALKHGNMFGTSLHGGVLVLAGDDHGAKSSSLAHQSEFALRAALIPVLNPASLHDYLHLGLFGWALSRAAGTWCGLKCVTETVESAATIDFDLEAMSFVEAEPLMPLQYRLPVTTFNPAAEEEAFFGYRLPAVGAFVRANPVDRMLLSPREKRLGLVSVGKAHGDLLQALADLGLDRSAAEALGIGLYNVQLSWPIEADGLRAFAGGFPEILVVEEKQAFVEPQLADALYHMPAERRPRIAGKRAPGGAPLLPVSGEYSPALLRDALLARLAAVAPLDPALVARAGEADRRSAAIAPEEIALPPRTPAFCSGCPHNRSTAIPEGSVALGGIGCHTMAALMPDRPTMRPTQMGGEGANWIGMAPFVKTPHIFQNLGDGTYFHSGLLAIRAAVAAGTTITFKLLFNDAVAMTGGQPAEGQQDVPQVVRQLRAEGVERVVVITDDVARYTDRSVFDGSVELLDRRALLGIEERLRAFPGVSVIVYEQICAAEKRRRRKRGTYPDPARRYVINDAVCEGCGDCGRVSNCVSLQPLPTPFGTKRRIDQNSCNKDYSCVEGFCPSFVTVLGGALRKPTSSAAAPNGAAALADPGVEPCDTPYNMLITGIGGTGVVTLGAILGTAAYLAGYACTSLDLTGISQKNGAVMSHVRIAREAEQLATPRIGLGSVDLLIGCDLIVAASADALGLYDCERTRAVVDGSYVTVAGFQQDRALDPGAGPYLQRLKAVSSIDESAVLEARPIAERLLGDSIFANMLLMGAAYQRGLIPLPSAAIERAIELNGAAASGNLAAFRLGRRLVADPSFAAELARDRVAVPADDLAAIVERHASHLRLYLNEAYAQSYRDFVRSMVEAECRSLGRHGRFSELVARNLGKLMAYKDEYEVARLYARPEFLESISLQFEGKIRLRFNLAPPLLARRDPHSGAPRKIEFGGWMLPFFRLLSRFRFLRGTALDPFGWTGERRAERALISDYRDMVSRLSESLSPEGYERAVAAAGLPDAIRGFGHVKATAIDRFRARRAELGLAAAPNVPAAP